MHKMKLGTKIVAGFGALIVIAIALGGLATIRMWSVVSESVMLADEYSPEAMLAGDLDRRTYRTMYAVRGYHFTGEKKYYDDGKAAMAQVKEAIKDLETLAAKAVHLVKLKGGLEEIKKAATEYERLMAETEKNVTELGKIATLMTETAQKYLDNANAFLKDQNEAMAREIKEGAAPDKLAERLLKITLVNDLIDLGNAARISNLKAQAQRDLKVMADGIKTLFPMIEKKGQELAPITRSAANQQQLKDVLAAAAAYKDAMAKYLAGFEELEKLNAARVTTGGQALEVSRELTKRAGVETNKIASQTAASLNTAATVVLIGLAIALIVGILLAVFITRSITGPIKRIIDALSSGADQVASASGQVSSASQQLAEGASEQAAAVEETSSSLEEMSSMTKQNADNAGQANSLMNETKGTVDRAASSMKEMSRAMDEITASGQEISKIIKTIDEIAFQTNLLALNAAVEAARAGEAGAGFAVVADEVRNLAMRAAEAAKNTASLIEGTIVKINQGTQLVKATDQAFVEVVQNANKVGELVGEIAAASAEQAQGIDQVNQAVTQMDSVTQRNAANAEESASASEELNAQAESMMDIVGQLQSMVGGAQNGVHRAAATLSAKPRHKALPQTPPRGTAPAKKAVGLARPQAKAPGKVVRADEVIPMDDDFADF
ncbi:MAG: methyl-accepting chemotaxis protein [Pseudomonadota bacterium]